jgi:hypothetical protein
MLVVAAMALMSGRCWAIYYGLPPSKDEWKLKYDVAVRDAGSDTLTVEFTLADEGRLKPFYSSSWLLSVSGRTKGRSYELTSQSVEQTDDGKRVGQIHGARNS